MSSYKVRKQRHFEEIDIKEIRDVIETKLGAKKLMIKYDIEGSTIDINELIDDTKVMMVTNESYEPDHSNMILTYILLDKYYEIEFDIIEKVAPGYFKCEIKSGRKAIAGRTEIRFKVNKDDVVATNFKISKHTIDFSMYSVPTTIKVILDQFEANHKSKYDFFKVNIFDKPDAILKHISKTGQTLHIENFNDPGSLNPMTDDFVNLKEVLGSEINAYIKRNIEKGYKSLILVPIIYITDDERSVPFGYIHVISKSQYFSLEDVISIKEKTFKLVDRIRDANTLNLSVKQRIIDISKNGVRLEVDNDELVKYLVKAKGFTFDIVFKLQAPITVFGEIKYTGNEAKKLMVGLSIVGNSSRKNEMKRFYQILTPMEIEYKKKLLAQMKMRKGLT